MDKKTISHNCRKLAVSLFEQCYDKCKYQSHVLDYTEKGQQNIKKLYISDVDFALDEFNKKWVGQWVNSAKKNLFQLNENNNKEKEIRYVFLKETTPKIIRFIEQLNEEKDLNTCFEHACTIGNLEVVKYLIDEKKSIYHLTSEKPFSCAVGSSSCELVQFLIEEDDENDQVQETHSKSFIVAADKNDIKMMKFLVDKGIKTTHIYNYDYLKWIDGYKNSKRLNQSLENELVKSSEKLQVINKIKL